MKIHKSITSAYLVAAMVSVMGLFQSDRSIAGENTNPLSVPPSEDLFALQKKMKEAAAAKEKEKEQSSPYVRHTKADDVPWINMSTLMPDLRGTIYENDGKKVLDKFSNNMRLKRVLVTPDFRLGHFIVASGMYYPTHSHAAPEAYHIISGTADWVVDGEEFSTSAGSTVYMKPYANHELVVTSKEPLKVVWAQWAPNGDRSYLGRDFFIIKSLNDSDNAQGLVDPINVLK